MTKKPSSDDQTPRPQADAIDRKTVITSACFLLVPSLIPLYFLKDAQGAMAKMLLVGISLLVLLGNGLIVLVLMRWLRKMKQADAPAQDPPNV